MKTGGSSRRSERTNGQFLQRERRTRRDAMPDEVDLGFTTECGNVASSSGGSNLPLWIGQHSPIAVTGMGYH